MLSVQPRSLQNAILKWKTCPMYQRGKLTPLVRLLVVGIVSWNLVTSTAKPGLQVCAYLVRCLSPSGPEWRYWVNNDSNNQLSTCHTPVWVGKGRPPQLGGGSSPVLLGGRSCYPLPELHCTVLCSWVSAVWRAKPVVWIQVRNSRGIL